MVNMLDMLQVETYIQKMKENMKVILQDQCKPYNGGRRCDIEIQFEEERQIYVLQNNFYASKEHKEPEISYLYFDEAQIKAYLLSVDKEKFYFWLGKTPKLIEKKMQQVLNELQKNGNTSASTDFEGDPWGGYTRQGFVITYQPTENNYYWENWFDNGLSESTTDTHIYNFEELKDTLKKIIEEQYY